MTARTWLKRIENPAWQFIRSEEFRRSRHRWLAWPVLILGVIVSWEVRDE